MAHFNDVEFEEWRIASPQPNERPIHLINGPSLAVDHEPDMIIVLLLGHTPRAFWEIFFLAEAVCYLQITEDAAV